MESLSPTPTKTRHRESLVIHKNREKYIPSPPTDSLNTKTERVNSFTFKCSDTGITSTAKHPQVEHHTWISSFQPNEQAEQHILRAIIKVTAITLSGGYFNGECDIAVVIIKGNKHRRHRKIDSSTAPGNYKYQDAYRSDTTGNDFHNRENM